MMPGDAVPAGVPGRAVTVSNTGTGALRYAIAGASTDADGKHLNTQLLITVRQPDGNAGSSCALMTGKHPGHGYIRENRGGVGQQRREFVGQGRGIQGFALRGRQTRGVTHVVIPSSARNLLCVVRGEADSSLRSE